MRRRPPPVPCGAGVWRGHALLQPVRTDGRCAPGDRRGADRRTADRRTADRRTANRRGPGGCNADVHGVAERVHLGGRQVGNRACRLLRRGGQGVGRGWRRIGRVRQGDRCHHAGRNARSMGRRRRHLRDCVVGLRWRWRGRQRGAPWRCSTAGGGRRGRSWQHGCSRWGGRWLQRTRWLCRSSRAGRAGRLPVRARRGGRCRWGCAGQRSTRRQRRHAQQRNGRQRWRWLRIRRQWWSGRRRRRRRRWWVFRWGRRQRRGCGRRRFVVRGCAGQHGQTNSCGHRVGRGWSVRPRLSRRRWSRV